MWSGLLRLAVVSTRSPWPHAVWIAATMALYTMAALFGIVIISGEMFKYMSLSENIDDPSISPSLSLNRSDVLLSILLFDLINWPLVFHLYPSWVALGVAAHRSSGDAVIRAERLASYVDAVLGAPWLRVVASVAALHVLVLAAYVVYRSGALLGGGASLLIDIAPSWAGAVGPALRAAAPVAAVILVVVVLLLLLLIYAFVVEALRARIGHRTV